MCLCRGEGVYRMKNEYMLQCAEASLLEQALVSDPVSKGGPSE